MKRTNEESPCLSDIATHSKNKNGEDCFPKYCVTWRLRSSYHTYSPTLDIWASKARNSIIT